MSTEQTPALTGKPHVASVVAVATGVLSLLVLPFVFGTIAVVAGIIGLVKSQEERRNAGFAITGLALGLAGILASVIVMYNLLNSI